MGAPALVHTPDDVTAEWLTSALHGAGVLAAGAHVASFEATPIGTGQMADTVRFALALDQPGAGPEPAWWESSPRPTTRVGRTGLALRAYEIEVRFYREVAGRGHARLPATYVAEVDPETGWFTLLLEDVVGATQGDQIEACDVGTAAAVLEEMAGLHAPCWDAGRSRAPRVARPETPESDQLLAGLMSMLAPGFLERYADTMAPEHQEVCRVFAQRIPLWGDLSAPRAAHGQPRRLPARQPLVPAGQRRGRSWSTGRPCHGRPARATWPTSSAAA